MELVETGATANRGRPASPSPPRPQPPGAVRAPARNPGRPHSTLTVTSNLDTGVAGDGSLRGEIAAATSGDTINFDPSLAGQTITLTKGELAISKNLDIEGLGPDQLTVSGNHASRIFDISDGATVTIAGMTMTDGLANGSAPVVASTGGAILNFGTLTLSNDVLSDNQAIGDASNPPLVGGPGSAHGGALANLTTGPLTISSCAFISNLALGADGSSGVQGAGNADGGAIGSRSLLCPLFSQAPPKPWLPRSPGQMSKSTQFWNHFGNRGRHRQFVC